MSDQLVFPAEGATLQQLQALGVHEDLQAIELEDVVIVPLRFRVLNRITHTGAASTFNTNSQTQNGLLRLSQFALGHFKGFWCDSDTELVDVHTTESTTDAERVPRVLPSRRQHRQR